MPSLANAAQILGKTDDSEGNAAHGSSWKEILATTTELNKNDVVEENWTIVFLGDTGCGKTSLVSKIRNATNTEHMDVNLGLDYSFLNLRNKNEEEHLLGIVDVWQLSGLEEHAPLLSIGVDVESLNDTIFVICVDLSQPWNIMNSLERWVGVIKDHLNTLDYPDGYRERLQDLVRTFFQSYQPFTAQEEAGFDDGDEGSDTPSAGGLPASPRSVSPTPMGDAGAHHAGSNKQAREMEQILLPLEEGALEENLGVTILVVGTKSDSFAELTQKYAFRDQHFDYIQQQLRMWCLKYGAGLVYTATRNSVNVEVLLDYLKHILYYKFPLEHPMENTKQDSIFIPIGSDTKGTISTLGDSSAALVEKARDKSGREPTFEEVIKKPPDLIIAQGPPAEVVAQDDQDFLAAWRDHFNDPSRNPRPNMEGLPELLVSLEDAQYHSKTITPKRRKKKKDRQ